MTTAHVLNERMSCADHSRGVQPFKTTHRPQPGLQTTMICFDGVICILLHDVASGGQQFILWGSNIELWA
jgi:hypothetical protein